MLSNEEQIRALVETWQAATKAGDVDTVLSLMTDDVVFLVYGRPPMRRRSLRRNLTCQLAVHLQLSTASPRFRRSKSQATWPTCGAHSRSRSLRPVRACRWSAGYTLTVFRHVDGKWLLARDANLLSPVQRPSS